MENSRRHTLLQWVIGGDIEPITRISSLRTGTARPVSRAIFRAALMAASSSVYSSTMMLPFCSPSSSLAMNFSRSSMGLHAFQGILRSPQKAPLCNPCLRNELSPLSKEGHTKPRRFPFLPAMAAWRMSLSPMIQTAWLPTSTASIIARI